ncbi:putative galanin receptor type 1, partial [Apostichopus japonicus]
FSSQCLQPLYDAMSSGLMMENSTNGSDVITHPDDPFTVSPVKEVIMVTYMALFPVSLTGNFLVIYVIVKNKKLRTVTNFFLGNLAVADLLVAIFCIIPKMMNFVMPNWPLGSIACSLHNYIVTVTTKASIFTLTLISFERYFAILHPFRVRHLLTTNKLAIATASLWAISLWLSIPIYLFYGTVHYQGDEFCTVRHILPQKVRISHDLIMMFLCFFLPLLLMILFYSKIIGKLWCGLNVMNLQAGFVPTQPASRVRFQPRFSFQTEITYNESSHNPVSFETRKKVVPGDISMRGASNGDVDENSKYLRSSSTEKSNDIAMANLRHSVDANEDGGSIASGSPVANFERHRKSNMYERNQTRRKVVRMLIAVVVAFTICMTPMQLFVLWDTVKGFPLDTTLGQLFLPFAYAMYFLNSCLNPIIYAILSTNFRSKMRETLLCNMTHAQTSVYSPEHTRKRSISESPTSV